MTQPPPPPPAPLPALPPPWFAALQQFAGGYVDASDLWDAIDDLVTGAAPYPYLAQHLSDLMSAEEQQATYAQADELALLLGRYFAGQISGDDLAAEALEVLGLGEPEEPDAPGG